MKRLLTVGAVLAALGASVPASAWDATLAAGVTRESTQVVRLALQRDFERSWWQTSSGRLTGYWDAGYTYWFGDKAASNHSLSFAPVFVYEFAGERVRPYVEAGIGVALFSSTEFEQHDLSTAFQFEDRLGFGLRFAGQEIGVRAIHYSNASLKQPNDGAETYTLHYRTAF
jgi:lipid A 3-O-deacylase